MKKCLCNEQFHVSITKLKITNQDNLKFAKAFVKTFVVTCYMYSLLVETLIRHCLNLSIFLTHVDAISTWWKHKIGHYKDILTNVFHATVN